MELYEVALLFLGAAFILGGILVIRYSASRSKDLDAQARRAFRPLYVYSIGLFVIGIACILTFYEGYAGFDFLPLPPENPGRSFDLFIVLVMIQAIIMAAAASMIVESPYMLIAVAVGEMVAFIIFYLARQRLAQFRVSSVADAWFNIATIINGVLILLVSLVFFWVARRNPRGTTVSMALTLMLQIFLLPRIHAVGTALPLVPTYVSFAILFAVLMAPAMLIFTFLTPAQAPSAELLGYGGSFAGPALIISGLVAAGAFADPVVSLVSVFGSLGIMLTMGTSSYLYGRYSESKSTPTLLFMLSFILFAAGLIIGLLGGLGFLPGTLSSYVELILTILALTLLSMTAIIAAGWRSVALLPLLLYIPTMIFIVQLFPTNLSEAIAQVLPLALATIAILLLPIFIFAAVGWRMRRTHAPGQWRPLGTALGIALYFVIRFPSLILPGLEIAYGFVFVSFLVFWASITGRLDKWAGTARKVES
ncbi:MAG: hypothetical protein EAX95_12765 [Candidatus Thorarchaeota archaeon]|nr:hypothetical protein [Candidatus Thorarchaeota archaeon]